MSSHSWHSFSISFFHVTWASLPPPAINLYITSCSGCTTRTLYMPKSGKPSLFRNEVNAIKLGQWPSFTGLEQCAPHTRVVYMAFSPPPMHSLCSMLVHTAAIMNHRVMLWFILAAKWSIIQQHIECTNILPVLLYLLCPDTSCLYDLRVIKYMFCCSVR